MAFQLMTPRIERPVEGKDKTMELYMSLGEGILTVERSLNNKI